MEGLELLEVVSGRYRTLREALVGPEKRRKRGLVDAGGTVLQWIFGVATGRDLEGMNGQLQALGRETTGSIHAVAQKATLVNETWRELTRERRYPRRIRKERFTLSKAALLVCLLTLATVESMGIGRMSTSATCHSLLIVSGLLRMTI
jgi:hypothetical protein